MDATNKGKNPAPQTKRVKSKRKLENITHQNTLKQIEEQEQLEGKRQIEDQNEEESDTSSVSATMPDLESTSNGEEEDEDYFEHDNVFPPESSNTLDVVKVTVLQVKKSLRYCQKILMC